MGNRLCFKRLSLAAQSTYGQQTEGANLRLEGDDSLHHYIQAITHEIMPLGSSCTNSPLTCALASLPL